MACFAVPLTEAVITTIISRSAKSREARLRAASAQHENAESGTSGRIPFSRKIGWLSSMLWGGSALLAFEHVWHGEVVPWFPFLTATSDPAQAAKMLHEMVTVGVSMSLLVTAGWSVMLIVSAALEKKAVKSQRAAEDSAI